MTRMRRLSTGPGTRVRYNRPTLNHNVFKQPVQVMRNIRRVTEHLSIEVFRGSRGQPPALTLVTTRAGQAFQ